MPRSAERPRVTVRSLAALLLLGVALLMPGTVRAQSQVATPSPAVPATVAATHLQAATSWLLAEQDKGGGFPGFDGALDPGTTTDAVMALAAAEASNPDAAAALENAVAYLEAEGTGYAAAGAGQAAKLALAAIAGARDPRAFGGVDLLAAMMAPPTTSVQQPIPGIYGDDLYDHALVLIALAAAGEAVDEAAIEPVRATQTADGGWAFDGSTGAGAADSNTTALVIQALTASGYADETLLTPALAFLASLGAPGGGFAYGPADPLVADANSTALVLQALIAAGEDPSAAAWGNAPLALAAFQTPSGGVRYLITDEEPNLLATLQAIPALAGQPLPVAAACATNEPADGADCILLAPAA